MENREQELTELLLEVFPQEASLMRFLRFGIPGGSELGTYPSGLPVERLVAQALDELRRRGLITLEFFDALRERAPHLGDRIEQVAAAWVPSIDEWMLGPAEVEEDPPGPALVFVSYARRDSGFLDELLPHLSLLRRRGVIDTWHEGRLRAGEEWASEIDRQIERAAIILLLVTPDFLSSDFLWGTELPRVLERSARGEATVIPIIVRHCAWDETPLAQLQVLPASGVPVVSHADTDEVWLEVARTVASVLSERQGD